MRKLIIAALATVSLNAYAVEDHKVEGFWEKFVCMGAGTCYRDVNGDLRKACSGSGCGSAMPSAANYSNYNTGATIVTNSTTYVVVPNASGGPYPAAVLNSGK